MLAAALFAARTYRLEGTIEPEAQASVTLFGATTPFTTSVLTGADGRFSIRNLPAGTYTLSVFVPGSGEARRTIEIGPGTADSRGRVRLAMRIQDADFNRDPLRRQHAVSTRQLAIPESAEREYQAAQKDLQKRDTGSAVRHLERAVEIAPGFATAWNNLGTVSYQTQNYARAEECFREALRQDPTAFEPLVNLGGVLINLNKMDEALDLNVYAVLTRPNDALANAQLGMAYFHVGNFGAAIKYLELARKIDPAHFSHPQIFLAEIHLRRGEPRLAADDLEDFVAHHPDDPAAAKMREKIAEWRK